MMMNSRTAIILLVTIIKVPASHLLIYLHFSERALKFRRVLDFNELVYFFNFFNFEHS